MSTTPPPSTDTSDREIVVTRVFDAPRELVWDAWTDPKKVVKWWGPHGFTTVIEEMDVRPGGVWKHVMHGPDGAEYSNKSVFIEVVKPERIVYSHSGGKKGDEGVSFEATWTFREVEKGKTELTMRLVCPTSTERIKKYGAEEGGRQTLERLAGELAKAPLALERVVSAPIETVWQAISDFEHMKQWYMPALSSFRPEVGFETEFSIHHEGKDFRHLWKVTEVVPGKKLAYSWKYAGYPGESFVTFELSPEKHGTRVKLTHVGLETFQPESHPPLARSNFLMGWTDLINVHLPAFVEKSVSSEETFTVTREVNAPRELVFKVWTEVEHLKHWWGPKGLTLSDCKVDLRPGGIFHYCMNLPNGGAMWGKFLYREIVAPERLVFVNSFSNEKGETVPPPFTPPWPPEMLNVVIFTEADGKTTITLRSTPINATDEERNTFLLGHGSMEQGFGGTFDQLVVYLAKL